MTITSTWAAMAPTEQLHLICACLKKAAPSCNPDELTGEVWIKATETMRPERLDKINAQRAAEGKDPITLVSVVYRAARATLAAAGYAFQKHSAASVRTVGEDEEPAVEVICAGHYDTETAAIIRADVDAMIHGRDAVDREIIAGLWLGLSMREIAKHIGISHVAVHHRIIKMRAVLMAA